MAKDKQQGYFIATAVNGRVDVTKRVPADFSARGRKNTRYGTSRVFANAWRSVDTTSQ